MRELTVRNIRFPIDDTVAFQWQPANPGFGLFGNTFTFLAIAFERYIVSATREALPRFTDADMAEEADLFVRQEAQHARAHRAHAKAMIESYPGLQETYAAANAAYDGLLERENTEFHLAYIANLEATFTPLFKMVFDNRHELFEGSDERVGTMLLVALRGGDRTPQFGSAHPPPCHARSRGIASARPPRSSTMWPASTSWCSLGSSSMCHSRTGTSRPRSSVPVACTSRRCAIASPCDGLRIVDPC